MEEIATFGPCSPFLIVTSIDRSLDHYVSALGFQCTYRGPDGDVSFAIINRGTAQIMLKVTTHDVRPTPNRKVHEWARWDAFVFVSDPDALAKEFADRNVQFHQPLVDDDDDGLRGFEIADPDGYICYFGRPQAWLPPE